MSRKIHVPFCRAVGGVTRLLTLIIPISHELEDNLAFFHNINLDPFPSEVIELDREGYPMDFDEESIATGYFDNDFVTPDEPF